MNEPMIHVEDLGICFRMDVNKTTNLKEWVIRALRRENKYNDFWALRNLSLDIMQGVIVGVIGRNGAGKRTLLKPISGTIEPAEGRIDRRARVVPML
ncbi:MAG: ATP-binding cassette domain-containing protein, partial [Eubacteriales bacterium]|nr:ATP-binding cassette domain-containing protein [Eubacteriales bacterium]